MRQIFSGSALSVTRSALSLIVSIFVMSVAKAQSGLPENPQLLQLLRSKELSTAHVGVYVYDDSSKKIIAAYQSDKYFVPASNTKLFSLYAGMKYLGDSLVGIRYFETDTALFITATGDPSLLHPDFQSQPVVDLLKKTRKKIYLIDENFPETPLGPGWSWDDYNEDYSIERSPLPVYGNFIRWFQTKDPVHSSAKMGPVSTIFSFPDIPWPVRFSKGSKPEPSFVKRLIDSNVFIIGGSSAENSGVQDVPFITFNLNSAVELLKDTIGKQITIRKQILPIGHEGFRNYASAINSRPVDSVFIPMMYRSDNFFAEQTLLMVSDEITGAMKEETVIDSLLNGPLAGLPQKPNWVDGSGLSRYNLFTPQDFVTLLIKFKNEFGIDRMKRILPTGGSGTLKNYYRADSGYIFMKTGSMSGVLCLSGYLYTNKKHLLEFSILVNNNNGGGSAIRREIESYVEYLLKNY